MTVLSTQLSGSLSSSSELLTLSKLQPCEADGSNYKVSCVRALSLFLPLTLSLVHTLQLLCFGVCKLVMTGSVDLMLGNINFVTNKVGRI